MSPNDYRWTENQKMKQLLRYGPEQYKEDWDTAIACAQLLSEPGHESLEVVLESCMMRVNAYAQVTGELPWE